MLLSVLKKISKILIGRGLGRMPFSKSLYYRLVSTCMPDIIEVNGMKMCINKKDRFVSMYAFLYGELESLKTDIIKKGIKKGMNVVDAGANIGYYTLLMARLVGSSGKVFAFEPDPENFDLLRKNVKLNGFKNVTLVRKALSDRSGNAELFLSEHNRGAHSMFNFNKEKKSVRIETVSLDDYFKGFRNRMKVNFIKMDIEGMEGKVLTGMENLIESNDELKIVTEFLVKALKSSGIRPENYLKDLENKGFKIFNIDEMKGVLEPLTLKNKVYEKVLLKKDQSNLLCIKN